MATYNIIELHSNIPATAVLSNDPTPAISLVDSSNIGFYESSPPELRIIVNSAAYTISATANVSATLKGWYSFTGSVGTTESDWNKSIATTSALAQSAVFSNAFYTTTTVVGNTTLKYYVYAKFAYVITWNANGGKSASSSTEVDPGSAVTTLPLAWRNGYDFVGWFTAAEGGEQITAPLTPDSNITYYAHWAPKTRFELCFDNLFVFDDWVHSDSNAPYAYAPLRGNVTFRWTDFSLAVSYFSSASGTANSSAGGASSGYYNIPVVAGESYAFSCTTSGGSQSRIARITITSFDASYNTVTSSAQSYTGTAGATSLAGVYTVPSGAAFIQVRFGLTTKGTSVRFSQFKLMPNEPRYTEVLVANVVKEVVAGSAVGELPTPTRDDATFLGWFTEPDSGNQYTSETIAPSANVTLYSRWAVSCIISAVAAPSTGGHAIVSNGSQSGSSISALTYETITATATPNSGYLFVQWEDPQGSILSTDSNYSFVATGDYTIHAVFAKSYVVALSVSPQAGGSCAGAGTYAENTTVIITATANDGYVFDSWVDDSTQEVVSSDDTYSFQLISDTSLTAIFVEACTVSLKAMPSESGMVAGAGVYGKGHIATISATSFAGNEFILWMNGDNGALISTNSSYSFPVETDVNYIAQFGMIFDVQLSVSPEGAGVAYGGGAFATGSVATLTAIASDEYVFSHWENSDGVTVSASATYSFLPVASSSFTAVFESSFSVTIVTTPENVGRVTGAGKYPRNGQVTVSAFNSPGYVFIEWQDAQGAVVSQSAQYTFSLQSDIALTAVYHATSSGSAEALLFAGTINVQP